MIKSYEMNSPQTEMPRFEIQDDQYKFPYHHLVRFDEFNNYKVMSWGFEYYAYMTQVMNLIKKLKPQRLLDIGCGEGKMILELSKTIPGYKMMGVDLSDRAILFAKAFNYGNGAIFEASDVINVKGEFDIITLVETMEHIPDANIPEIVKNISTRLNVEGRVIVTVPSTNFPLQAKHYRHYDLELILKQFEGFSLVSEDYLVKEGFIHGILIRFSRKFCSFLYLRKLFFLLAKIFVFNATKKNGRHIICVLKKI